MTDGAGIGEHRFMSEDPAMTRKQLLVKSGALALSTGAAGALLSACDGGSNGDVGAPRALAKASTRPFDPNVKPGAKPNLPHEGPLERVDQSDLIHLMAGYLPQSVQTQNGGTGALQQSRV